MKSIFIGDWIYKSVSYYKYKQKQPLKGDLNLSVLGILKHNK